jgi:hypothetical protein
MPAEPLISAAHKLQAAMAETPGAVSTRFCNVFTQRLCSNFDAMRAVAEAMGDVPVLDRSVDTEKAAAFVAELRTYGADATKPDYAAVSNLADDVEAAIPHIRYITKAELLEAHDAIIERLNSYAAESAEKYDLTVQYCVMMPSFDEALKSNMWVGLRVLRHCYGPAWGLAASLQCEEDLRTLKAYVGVVSSPSRPVTVQCLFFDDVMYSGGQMRETLHTFLERHVLRGKSELKAAVCVPFVHDHKASTFKYIHPAIKLMVIELSQGLPIAETYIRREQGEETTLTYTQTKVPDYASFPSWLARLTNPYTAEYNTWLRDYVDDKTKRGGAFPLFRNCDNSDRSHSCMTGSYVPVLQQLQGNKGVTKLRDFCTKTDVQMLFNVKDGDIRPRETGYFMVVREYTTAIVTKLADDVTVLTASPEFTHHDGMFAFKLTDHVYHLRKILLTLADVGPDKIQLFMDTVIASLVLFQKCGAIPPEDPVVRGALLTQRNRDVEVYSLQVLTIWPRLPGDQYTADGLTSEILHFIRKSIETRLANYVTPIVTSMHTAGMAHGKIADPASYRFGITRSRKYYKDEESVDATLDGVMLHPASFTHTTFRDRVDDAQWRSAVAADLRSVDDLVRAMMAKTDAAWVVLNPKKTAAPHRDDDDDGDGFEDGRPPMKQVRTG